MQSCFLQFVHAIHSPSANSVRLYRLALSVEFFLNEPQAGVAVMHFPLQLQEFEILTRDQLFKTSLV